VGFLELAANAGLGDLHFAHRGQVEGFAEPGVAVAGPGLAGDHVHQRGLPAPLGPMMQRSSPTPM
jgi:hypothetical protein